VAKAEAILEAERQAIRDAKERAKNKIKAAARRKIERERAKKALKKAKEKEKRDLLRAEAVAEREAARTAIAREKEKARAKKERERKKKAAAREAAQQEKEAEKARIAKERADAKAAAAKEKAALKAEREAARRQAAEEKAQRASEKLHAREEARRAKEEAKLAAAREREAARQAKEEAKLAASRLREEEKVARLKAKEEAAAKKKSDALAKKKEKKQLKEVQRNLTESDRNLARRIGGNPAQLMDALLDVMIARPDVRVLFDSRGPMLQPEDLIKHAEDVPPDVLAWYREMGPLEFSWAIKGERKDFGGQLEIPPLADLRWTPRGRYLLGDDETREWLSIEEYLTEGAQSLFTWQRGDILARLLSASAPSLTAGAMIVNTLVEKGFEEKTSKGLVSWLGKNARALIHESETEEGKRRLEVLKQAEELPVPAGKDVHVGLVDTMNSGPPVKKKEWQLLVAAHGEFLAQHGGQGRWESAPVHGMPRSQYHPPDDEPLPSGQAKLPMENLTGLKCSGVKLPYADLSGVRGEQTSFSKADLRYSILVHSCLDLAIFQGADLTGCDFTGSRLAGADFRKANLTQTNFERADLTGANFAGAITNGTKFGGANVSKIRY
jgi:hypothetical protein